MEPVDFDVDEIPFGHVYIAGGKHKGKIGYYDDDDGKRAIVYFDVPFISEYTFVRKRYLQPVTYAGSEKIAEYMEKEKMWMNPDGEDYLEEPIDTASAEWKEKVSKIVSPYDRLFPNKKKVRFEGDWFEDL